jgi:hypothetical protein
LPQTNPEKVAQGPGRAQRERVCEGFEGAFDIGSGGPAVRLVTSSQESP